MNDLIGMTFIDDMGIVWEVDGLSENKWYWCVATISGGRGMWRTSKGDKKEYSFGYLSAIKNGVVKVAIV